MKKLLLAALFCLCACTDSSVSETSDGDSEYDCYPGTLRCNSDSIEKCSQSGVWTEYLDCSKSGKTCLFDNCVPSEDGDESEYEDGDIEEIAGDSEETTETEIPDGDAPEGEDLEESEELEYSGDSEESEEFEEEPLENLVWVDYENNLIWQKQLPMEEDPQNGFLKYNYSNASKYCSKLELAGFSNWRLPKIDELRLLILGCNNTESGGACPLTSDCYGFTTCFEGNESICSCEELSDCYCKDDLPCWYNYQFGEITVKACANFWASEDASYYGWSLDFGTAGFLMTQLHDDTSISTRCVHDIVIPLPYTLPYSF